MSAAAKSSLRRSLLALCVFALALPLVGAPVASGADGDRIATSKLTVKFKGAFKKQLRSNGVKMKSKGFKISQKLNSDVDPTTGKADLRLGKVVFKKDTSKVVYDNLKGTLPGNVISSQSGKLFKLSRAKVDRQGFGAALNGIKVKFPRAAARKLNRQLDLNSLHKANVGTMSLSYVPKTVKVIGGVAQTTSFPIDDAAFPNSVGVKLRFGHCVDGGGAGITPIAPATKENLGPLPTSPVRLTFPVIDGEISLDGKDGESETAGGLRIRKSDNVGPCASAVQGELTQEKIVTDITAGTISSEVNILASPAPAGTTAGPGPKGRAVGQTIDATTTAITIDKANRTFTLDGSVVQLAPVSAQTLNAIFPCVNNCDDAGLPGNYTLMGGDKFGTSKLTVVTR